MNQIELIRDMRADGCSYGVIGRQLRMSRSAVAGLVYRHKIEGPRQPKIHLFSGGYTPEKRAEVVAYMRDHSYSVAADRFGINRYTIMD